MTPSEGLEYELSADETYYIVTGKGSCNDTDIVIPSVYEDKPVKGIGDYALCECPGITSVTIPDSVISIGEAAFGGCPEITSIIIPDSVISIGELAFALCPKLTSIKVSNENTAYKSVDGNLYTKDGKTLIQYAIGKKDTSFIISDSVETIGEMAFYDCTGLRSVTIGYNVKTIGEYAFPHCSSLTSVTIGNSVETIGFYAFYECESLMNVYITDIAKWCDISFDDGCSNPLNSGAKLNIKNILVTELVIPDSVRNIGNNAFFGCTSLTSVSIGNNVKTIGEHAFADCSSLTSVTIGNNVETIGDAAFIHCNNLMSVTMGNSVETIGNYAFNYCYKLVEVINKSSLTITVGNYDNGYVGYYALEVHKGESKILNKDGYLFYTVDGVNYLLGYTGTDTALILPSEYNGEGYEIYKYAFYNGTGLTSITIPNCVTKLGYSAFCNCTELTEIKFNAIACADLVRDNRVFDNAGKNSSGITVSFGDSVKHIPAYLLDPIYMTQYRPNIKTVVIGNSVETIGDYAFSGSYKLVEVINKSALNVTTTSYGLNAIEVHNGDSKIVKKGDYLFYTCDGVNYLIDYIGTDTVLTLPSDYNGQSYQINKYAFIENDNLTSVVITDKVTCIGNRAFQSCDRLTSVTIGSGVESIEEGAFNGCYNLTSVVIPDSVTSIGAYAFSVCNSLTSINYRGTEAQWNAISKGDYWCSGTETITYNYTSE